LVVDEFKSLRALVDGETAQLGESVRALQRDVEDLKHQTLLQASYLLFHLLRFTPIHLYLPSIVPPLQATRQEKHEAETDKRLFLVPERIESAVRESYLSSQQEIGNLREMVDRGSVRSYGNTVINVLTALHVLGVGSLDGAHAAEAPSTRRRARELQAPGMGVSAGASGGRGTVNPNLTAL